MSVTASWVGRPAGAQVVAALRTWEPPGGRAHQLHAGDVGWAMRFEDEVLDGALLVVRDGSDDLVAAGLLDGPASVRLAVDPRRTTDRRLAGLLADAAQERLAPGEGFVDGPPDGAWQAVLAARGWAPGPDPWLHLWQAVQPGQVRRVTGVRPVAGPVDVADRVAVQRGAFDNSTFTEARWRLMSEGPAYEPALDLVARDGAGTPVAAATAWSAGVGRCGILEPVGTHRDHQGRGHGRRLLEACVGALAAVGASGAAVFTPAANIAAAAAYRSAGFDVVATVRAMRRAG